MLLFNAGNKFSILLNIKIKEAIIHSMFFRKDTLFLHPIKN